MKKIIVCVAALSLLATAAVAATMSATVKSIDKSSDAVTLDNGQTLTLPEGIEAESLKIGEKVQVTYSTNAASKVRVESIKPAK